MGRTLILRLEVDEIGVEVDCPEELLRRENAERLHREVLDVAIEAIRQVRGHD